MISEKNKKIFEDFQAEQFKILLEHQSRCLLRCYNKLMELKDERKS